MTRRKQFQPKRLTYDSEEEEEGKNSKDTQAADGLNERRNGASGEDEEDDKKECEQSEDADMQIDNDSNECTTPDPQEENTKNISANTTDTTSADIPHTNGVDKPNTYTNNLQEVDREKKTMSVGDTLSNKNSLSNDNIKDKRIKSEIELNGEYDEKENLVSVKHEKKINELDVERELKKELREAVETRGPKLKLKKEEKDQKWSSGTDGMKFGDRPETPPLQKLMRHEFSPLNLDMMSPSPPKRMKDSSSMKDGYALKLASVIVPSTSVPVRTASHPKQLLSHSLANLRSSAAMKHFNFSKTPLSPPSFPTRSFHSSKSSFSNSSGEEQPLDLSKKPSKEQNENISKMSKSSSRSPFSKDFSKLENGLSSTTLQSLQQKFGGDYHLRGLRKPASYMLFGPEIPALHQALLHSAAMPLSHHALPMSNGMPRLKQEQNSHHSFRHRNSTPSPSHKVKLEESIKSSKREDPVQEKSIKSEKSESGDKSDKVKLSATSSSTGSEDTQTEKYTNHMCTCGKWYDTLYSLSLHLQETGHLPARNKSVSLLEYPKLVRGQDMWLNQESEQTRRILRCIQCGESFKTLPMLTVHMMKTQHYTKIVSSEHARRAHKCSAYCDKEQDKDCVFKCKVCQDTFSDMEGLANHMIMSGHHKKQMMSRPPPPISDLHFRQRRKRYYGFEENFFSFGNPSVSPILDTKKKPFVNRSSPDLSVDADSDDGESTISCENCGKKIETRLFVDHVRACIGQRLSEDLRLKDITMGSFESEKKLKNSKNDVHSYDDKGIVKSPTRKRKIEVQDSENEDDVESESRSKNPKSNDNIEEIDKDKSGDIVKDTSDDCCTKVNISNNSEHQDRKSDCKTDSDDLDESGVNKSLQEIQDNDTKLNIDADDRPKVNDSEIPDNKSVLNEDVVVKTENKSKLSNCISKKLDIIDPNNSNEESASAGSALSAMESFIEKSFSNKFDYKKGNIIINPQSSADATIHSRPQSSAMNLDSIDYLSKYTKFYSVLHNGLGAESTAVDRTKTKVKLPDEHDKNGIAIKCEGRPNGGTPSLSEEEKEDGRTSVKSFRSNDSGSLDNNENLEKKYLNILENENNKTDAKSSALDNLSSFVYGQPMTSEHPLDSLQRLITKADIPKLMMSHGARAFKYLPPHLQLHHSNPDLTVPLNLSVKSQNGDSDEDEDRLRPEEESLSDYEAASSPTNSDGDPVEYRCAACSRRFASKGSYRYHLSRCHLSSVKRYGIKEAFNMSPYVYLPLDHTAKFSKYYEMAKELANKRK